MDNPLVSIITPTFNREAFLPAIAACVQKQSVQDVEWLVFDDSERPSAALTNSSWDKLRYIYSPTRLSIGEKRNRLIDAARADIIIQMDDDDYYGANYVADMVKVLNESGADLALMSGFFCHHLNTGQFGYYRTLVKRGPAFQFNRNGVEAVKLDGLKIPLIHLCYGWSYIFRKQLWADNKFDEINVFEDRQFVLTAKKIAKVVSFESKRMSASHSVHNLSSSQCFPQFLIPEFLVGAVSPDAHRHIVRLRMIVQKLNKPNG